LSHSVARVGIKGGHCKLVVSREKGSSRHEDGRLNQVLVRESRFSEVSSLQKHTVECSVCFSSSDSDSDDNDSDEKDDDEAESSGTTVSEQQKTGHTTVECKIFHTTFGSRCL